jgi:hypothetical protein
MDMHPVFRFLDPVLIWFYRITGYAPVDFVIGTLVLAFLAVVLGEVSLRLVLLVAQSPLDKATAEARRYQNLSMDALATGDRPTYEAANELANDAFGKTFFMQIAQSGAFLWPVGVALAWMGYRFADLAFPLPVVQISLGYVGAFLLLYIPAYFLFKRVKRRLPYFRHHPEGVKINPVDQATPPLASGPATPARDR